MMQHTLRETGKERDKPNRNESKEEKEIIKTNTERKIYRRSMNEIFGTLSD